MPIYESVIKRSKENVHQEEHGLQLLEKKLQRLDEQDISWTLSKEAIKD